MAKKGWVDYEERDPSEFANMNEEELDEIMDDDEDRIQY